MLTRKRRRRTSTPPKQSSDVVHTKILGSCGRLSQRRVSAIERLETLLQDSRLRTDTGHRLPKNTKEEWKKSNDTGNSRGNSIT